MSRKTNKMLMTFIRLAAAPGYISFLVTWTSLLGLALVRILPFLQLERSQVNLIYTQPATQSSSSGEGQLISYIVVLIIVLILWSVLVTQAAKLFVWFQIKLHLKESQLLSVKVGGLAVGWLLFAPIFHSALAGFGSIYIWLISGLMLLIGIISFAFEHALSHKYKLKQREIW